MIEVPPLVWHIIMGTLLSMWLMWSMVFAVQIIEDGTALARHLAAAAYGWFHGRRYRHS